MKHTLYLGLLFVSSHLFAQHEADHWFFGFSAGLGFTSGSPVPEPGSPIFTGEGTSSISDPSTGDLLFYTDGISVFDATHTLMPNGSGLMGNFSTTQSALVVPMPQSNTLYYVFTNDCVENNGISGCRYSVVDMTLNGGLGDVTATKNVLLHAPTSEQLSAVKHANCVDWWIMTKELNNNVYHAYLLTASGITLTVTSTVGAATGTRSYGQGKFSPDGTKYAINTGNLIGSTYYGMTQLFDFDNSTGLLSNPLMLLNSTTGNDTYGLSFSGDNSKLYTMRGTWGAGLVYQYDLSSGVPATILASATYIGDCEDYAQMQLGHDGKIYIAKNGGSSYISVINNPNIAGTGCGLDVGTVALSMGWSYTGISNFPDSYFNETSPCDPLFTANAHGYMSCKDGESGTAYVTVRNNVGPYTVLWSPGGYTQDTITGLAAGVYNVSITDSAGTTITDSVEISFDFPDIIISGNDLTCKGDSLTLNTSVRGGSSPYSYQWSTAADDTTASVTFIPTSTGEVIVTVKDMNGCTMSDTFKVYVSGIQIAGDTCICSGQSITLSALGGSAYVWSTGQTSPDITVTPGSDTVITVSISGSPCTTEDEIHVCIYPAIEPEVYGDTSMAAGGTATLMATGDGTFSWSPSLGLSCVSCNNPLASPLVSTWYTVTLTDSNGCKAGKQVFVEIESILFIPNIITPNGDGVNDVFRIENLPPSSVIHIFNRWGNTVFMSDDYQNNWEIENDGVYFFILQIPGGKTYHGFIQVTGN